MRKSFLSLVTGMVFTSLNAQAYFSTMDTGELTGVGQIKVLAETPVTFAEPNDGFNLNGRFSTGLNEDSEIQGEIGLGASADFSAGAFWKYIPFPDTYEQPSIGGRAGLVYITVDGLSTYGVNLTPMVSKNFDGSYGRFTPYLSLPVGILTNNRKTFMSFQATAGLEWSKWVNMRFLVEYSVSMKDALDYLSVGASFDI